MTHRALIAMRAALMKDLRLEWRARTRMKTLLFFSFATMLIISFAIGPMAAEARKMAAAYYWIAMLFASTLGLAESFRAEYENRALSGLLNIPASARILFVGKVLTNTLLLSAIGAPLFGLMCVLLNLSLMGPWSMLPLIIGLSAIAISAPGTLFCGMLPEGQRSRDILLPLLLFPLLVPAVIGAVKATGLVIMGDSMNDLPAWLSLLALFDIVYVALGLFLFAYALEE